MEKPNFWSSWAVAMYSWVCASTPAVTRTITRTVVPRRSATSASRSISAVESAMTRPTPTRSATASSPPVHTSRHSPSSATQRATAVHRNALPA